MKNLSMALIVLAAVSLLLAIICAIANLGPMGVSAEGFSRGSGNLALLAIALLLASKE
jgi:hypothetical protein